MIHGCKTASDWQIFEQRDRRSTPGHEKNHEKTIGDHDIVRGKDPVGRYRR